MNTTSNTPSPHNGVILRLIGGERDGQSITVSKDKFLLSSLLPETVDAEEYRCAIFRGEKGVALRSYSDHILCNGVKVSVQWLKKGDLVKLTDQFSIEVLEVGVYKPAAAKVESRLPVHTVAVETTSVPGPVLPALEGELQQGKAPSLRSESTPTISLPSVQAATDTPAFKPATDNFALPSVTAPLNHHVSTPMQRMPANTYAVEVVPAKASPDLEPAADADVANVPSEQPEVLESKIDSVTDRLSKLVDNAGDSGVADEEQTTQPETSADTQTPVAEHHVSTPMQRMPANTYAVDVVPANVSAKQPEVLESKIDSVTDRLSKLVDNTGGSGVADEEQTAQPETPAGAQPPAAVTSAAVTSAAEEVQTTPQIEDVQSVVIPPMTPATDSQPTTSASQPEAKNDPTDRRSALEQYFTNNGVSLNSSQGVSEPEIAKPSFSPVSSPETSAPVSAPEIVSPEIVAEPVAETPTPPETPEVNEEETASVDAVEASKPGKPMFDLDSVLATLGNPSIPAPAETSGALAQPEEAIVAGETNLQTSEVFGSVESSASVVEPVSMVPAVAEPNSADAAFNSLVESYTNPKPVANQPPEAKPAATEEIVTDSVTEENSGGQTESFKLLESLGLDTSELHEIKSAIAAPSTSDPVEATGFEATAEPVEEAPQPPVEQESVADVLARMNLAGSLSDLRESEDESTPEPEMVEPVVAAPAPTPAPQAEPATMGAGDDEDSVEDYMSKLLGRMRGDEESTADEPTAKAPAEKPSPVSESPATIAGNSVSEPAVLAKLTEEEFVPKQKAVRMHSLESLREIANTSAREAIRDSLAKERKVSTQTKMSISLIALAFSVLFFIMSYLVVETVNRSGVFCGIIFLVIGILTARTYLSERKMDQSIMSE